LSHSRLRHVGGFSLLLICALACTSAAQAVPLFARQTALKCGMCHSPPPELTTFGRRFKLSGYTLNTAKKPSQLPVSVIAFMNHVATREDVETAYDGASSNDNTKLQSFSINAGGRISDSVGAYAGIDYDGIDDQLGMGNLDLRWVGNRDFAGKDLLYGLTLHNDPSYQDPWNSSPRRISPYLTSTLEPQPSHTVALDGLMSRRVLGAGGYGFLENSLYLELAAYRPISNSLQDDLGLFHDFDYQLSGTGWYARIAKEYRLQLATLTFGALVFDGEIEEPFDGPTYTATDFAVDTLYQRQRGKHDWTLSANLLHESIDTSDARDAGFARTGSNDITRLKINTGYLFNKTYGLTGSYFKSDGSTDALFFRTASGGADTSWLRMDAYWNPLSKKPIKAYPLLRTRIGLQYTHFTEFDGDSNNYNETGRDASDNDTLMLYWIFAF
jgi:hypothetical protein